MEPRNYSDIQERLKDETNRNNNQSVLLEDIQEDLTSVMSSKKSNEIDLLNLFRALRNLCIASETNQTQVFQTKIPNLVVPILIDSDYKLTSEIKTVGLQFIGNLITGNKETCERAWPMLYPSLFECFMLASPFCDKHYTICSMILYNCSLETGFVYQLFDIDVGKKLILSICESVAEISDADWILLLMKMHFFKKNDFMPLIIMNCSATTMVSILELYCDEMQEGEAICNDFVAIYLAEVFSERFIICTEHPSKDKATVLASIIRTLCWATASPGHWHQDNAISSAADNAVKLLQLINLYKEFEEGDDNFKLAVHLHKLQIKRDIVRLIGNLCFDNRKIQDLTRSNGGIPLLLAACTIDDNNPFLQQWAIFAIRNLCQNNYENQVEVAKFEKLAVADSPVLDSMGLTAVEDENGKIIIREKN